MQSVIIRSANSSKPNFHNKGSRKFILKYKVYSLKNLNREMFKATPEFVIAFIKLFSSIGCSWPLQKNATKFQIIIYNVKWLILLISMFIGSLAVYYAAYKNTRDIVKCTGSLTIGFNISQVYIKMIIFKFYYKKYQNLIYEMEKSIKFATSEEKKMYVVCIKRCCKLYVTIISAAIITGVFFIFAPMKIPQPFPLIAEYPFPVDTDTTFKIIYIQHTIVTIQCMSIPVFDSQIAMLLWYAATRLELLGNQFKRVTDEKKFLTCLREHQYLLRYIDEIITCGRYIIATTVVTCTVAVITSGINLVANRLTYDKISFVIISTALPVVLYLSAWPSEHLTQMYQRIGDSLYCSPWYKNSKQLNRSVLIAIQRSQNPPVIRVSGLLPHLSLPYFSQFLSKIFSYFTTLRVILSKMPIAD